MQMRFAIGIPYMRYSRTKPGFHWRAEDGCHHLHTDRVAATAVYRCVWQRQSYCTSSLRRSNLRENWSCHANFYSHGKPDLPEHSPFNNSRGYSTLSSRRTTNPSFRWQKRSLITLAVKIHGVRVVPRRVRSSARHRPVLEIFAEGGTGYRGRISRAPVVVSIPGRKGLALLLHLDRSGRLRRQLVARRRFEAARWEDDEDDDDDD